MSTLANHQHQHTVLEQLRASSDPQTRQHAEKLQPLYHDREMAGLADDVYDSAKGEGQPSAGWVRASEHLDKLREYAPQLNMTDDQIRDLLKPDSSGFRAEIYLPDPAVLGPGYKPTLAYKGSAGEVLTPDGLRPTGSEDFVANNFPQSVGLKTDYYDRAMSLAYQLSRAHLDFEITGHSLGGGMASAAAAVTGMHTTTFNAAGLHPLTAQRFAQENGLPVYDPQQSVIAYQVSGEVLNDGIQQNIHRLDAFRRAELGAVLKETCTVLNELPQGKALLASQLDATLPAHAQPAAHAFLDRLQHGNTAQLLRELPLAAGQMQPLLAAKQHATDGQAIVDRPARLSLRDVSNFAGPALDALHVTSQGVRVGRSLGGVVAESGQVAGQGLDAAGDLAQRAALAAAQIRQSTTQRLGAAAGEGVEQAGALAAQGRQVLGEVQAGAERLQGQAQGEAASLGAAALRGLGGMLPQGLEAQLTAQAERLAQAGAAAEQRGQNQATQLLHEAADDARQIRQHGQVAGQALNTAASQVGQAEHASWTAAGAQANALLDTTGRYATAASALAPEIYATQAGVATAAVATYATHNPTNPQGLFNLGKTGEFASKLGDSLDEATERHLMTETVLPSMDALIQEVERKARTQAAPEQAQTQAAALGPGDRGTEVQALQASLIQLGINERIKTPVAINGLYDQPTQRGVQAFQLMHGMDEVNGIADHHTRAAVQQQASVAIAPRDMVPPYSAPAVQATTATAASASVASAPERLQVELSAQQQQQALEQQRHWQLHMEQTVQQERERLAEEEKAAAQREQATVASDDARQSPGLLPFSDPAHPGHALYADVKHRLDAKGTPLPEDRLTQVTAAVYIDGFRAGWRGRVDVVNENFFAQHYDDITKRVNMSLTGAAPSVQESMQQVQTHALETARQQEAIAQASRDQPTPPVPVV
ncbi:MULTISPECIES: peptidoglycan-binding domain-containing protein [Xanthomonas]|uniref:Peptidoglycan-binding protein n=1 Tax=Xanthomonas cucurbitae TaxID=56453 RepID=A0ABY7YE56_9XANT|nr:peptidoglycan-binding protein [Xanthomonas cucurbitae]QHG88416.1 peptidoglycan-binding protein [Xanthomonas cucurbitae]WDM68208.1 peptidoglycan-binding protein [Xanthomonas cucurbitae]WDM72082.1 peptidoglycan-binding protein [Xanthomonas cucurbitae]WDM74988.1 peptidoglycan-binding protein [Xanthomonas cucurbitae]